MAPNWHPRARLLSQTTERIVNDGDRLVIGIREQVTVDTKRDGGGAVPQAPADRQHIQARRDEGGGVRMPQGVEGDFGESTTSDDAHRAPLVRVEAYKADVSWSPSGTRGHGRSASANHGPTIMSIVPRRTTTPATTGRTAARRSSNSISCPTPSATRLPRRTDPTKYTEVEPRLRPGFFLLRAGRALADPFVNRFVTVGPASRPCRRSRPRPPAEGRYFGRAWHCLRSRRRS